MQQLLGEETKNAPARVTIQAFQTQSSQRGHGKRCRLSTFRCRNVLLGALARFEQPVFLFYSLYFFQQSNTFEATFYTPSPMYKTAEDVCFPYLDATATKCKVRSGVFLNMYQKSVRIEVDDNQAERWTTDLDNFGEYTGAYRKGRNDLVRECSECLSENVATYRTPLNLGKKLEEAAAFNRQNSGLLATYRQLASIAKLKHDKEKEKLYNDQFQKLVSDAVGNYRPDYYAAHRLLQKLGKKLEGSA
jgi:hypothetical protein